MTVLASKILLMMPRQMCGRIDDVKGHVEASEILNERMLGEDQLERVARTARRCRGALGGALGRVSTRVLPHE